MEICHAHNLNAAPATSKRYGVRVSLPPSDPFTRLIGREWERVHWFATSGERDRALQEMASEHVYSRRGDRPALRFEAIEISRPAR